MSGPSAFRVPLGRRAVLHVAALVGYLVVIFVLGSLDQGAPEAPGGDKVAHLGAFALCCWLAWRASDALAWPPTQAGRALCCVGFSSLAGGLLEVWQAFLPHRSAEVADWLADSVGAVVMALLLALYVRGRGRAEPG